MKCCSPLKKGEKVIHIDLGKNNLLTFALALANLSTKLSTAILEGAQAKTCGITVAAALKSMLAQSLKNLGTKHGIFVAIRQFKINYLFNRFPWTELNLYIAAYFCILDPSILLFLCILEHMTI